MAKVSQQKPMIIKERVMKTVKVIKLLSPTIIAAALFVAIIVAIYFYVQLNQLKKDPKIVAQKEVVELVEKVSKLAVLPADETPTIATVSDLAALKDQPFFEKAQVGDKVLIYAQAKKAILYSISMNKILDVAPLNIGTTSIKPTDTPAPITPTVPTTLKK